MKTHIHTIRLATWLCCLCILFYGCFPTIPILSYSEQADEQDASKKEYVTDILYDGASTQEKQINDQEAPSREIDKETNPTPESCSEGARIPCYSGPQDTWSIGICRMGFQRCTKGTWGPCTNEILPQKEVCNAQDDDCDGQVDEDFLQLETPCSKGIGECKVSSVFTCKDDGTGEECPVSPNPPKQEVCNGLDDNCNGKVDETGRAGCRVGQTCTNGKCTACPVAPIVQCVAGNQNRANCGGRPPCNCPCGWSCYCVQKYGKYGYCYRQQCK
ncbi:MAG: hypothetical protein CL920_34560 [Deltaproteobacteria bacterium]|nr:hypothetical protein [Deltaproteobacteria bacterium]